MTVPPATIGSLPNAWLGVDMRDATNWRVAVPAEVIKDLRRVVEKVEARGLHPPHVGMEMLRIESLVRFAQILRDRLTGQPAFVVVTGFPIEEYSPLQTEIAYWTFGAHLGVPVSQSRAGDFIGRVEDIGADIARHDQRGYQSSAALPFHVDRTDLVALLCVRNADAGGLSLLASAPAVHNLLLAERPELLALLYESLPHDRRGEELTSQKPWCLMPVFASVDGSFVARYVRRFVMAAQRWPDAPKLSQAQIAALDALDGILARPEVALSMRLQPGDIQLIDNFRILHSRTAFTNGSTESGRLLLRLWLSHCDSPPLPDEFNVLYGSTGAGTYRGGVWPAAWPKEIGQALQPLR